MRYKNEVLINTNDIMKRTKQLIVIFQLLILGFCPLWISAQSKTPTNVIVILADDIGLGDIGYYHQQRTGKKPVVATPNIDKLINEGIRFSDAHSPASLCAPTRFSMLTGNFSYRNTKGPWGVWQPFYDNGINPNYTTIARIAKQGGYNTAFFGKWGLGGLWNGKPTALNEFEQTNGTCEKLGFDYSFVLPQGIQNEPYSYYENDKWVKLKDNSELVRIPFEQTDYEEDERENGKEGVGDSNWDATKAGPMLVNKATDYINKQAKTGKPFFLYYCSQAVHVPHSPSKNLNGTDIAGTTPGKHGDMIKELDAQIALIVATLKKNNLYDNTLLVFTSDNGGLNKDKTLSMAGHDSSNGLTGQKGSIYEGGHRVPFIAVWPEKIKAGTESNVPILGQDMVATLASMINTPLDKSKVYDSANLLPILLKQSKKPVHQYILHQSQAQGGPYYALREGDWKLVFWIKKREDFDNMKAIGLYNLKQNPIETDENNLINNEDQKERIETMTLKYKEMRLSNLSTIY